MLPDKVESVVHKPGFFCQEVLASEVMSSALGPTYPVNSDSVSCVNICSHSVMLNSFLQGGVGTQSEKQAPVHATRRGEVGRGGRERGGPNAGVRRGEVWMTRARCGRC